MTPILFYPNFGGVLDAPDQPYWGQTERKPLANHREIIFQVFRPM